MFANVVQPSLLSLFSSTGTAPLQLFSQHVDPSLALRSDSLIHLLNDTTSEPPPPNPGMLVRMQGGTSDLIEHYEDQGDEGWSEGSGGLGRKKRTLCQTVLHIQSPTLRTTCIRCPPASARNVDLALTLPWMHLHVRMLGDREWTFEVGVMDGAGRKGTIRCSTFQKEATLKTRRHNPPLLHVPLRFLNDALSPQVFTAWRIVSLDLGSMINQFRTIAAAQQSAAAAQRARDGHGSEEVTVFKEEELSYGRTVPKTDSDIDLNPHADSNFDTNGLNASVMLPSGTLGRVTYVKIFANCRLRRIWFSENKRGSLPWEFALYASVPPSPSPNQG